MTTPDGIRYRPDFKAWWPDYDHKPEKCFAFVQRGLQDLEHSLRWPRKKDVCVQAGGHAGFWPLRLSKAFQKVYTFECEPSLYSCMERNLADTDNVTMCDKALGRTVGHVLMKPHPSAGSWRIDPAGTIRIEQTTIDALQLSECDAIYLDVEGYEVEALKGADMTIDRFRPVIHVEELPRAKDAIDAHLRHMDYRMVQVLHNDRIYVPTETL